MTYAGAGVDIDAGDRMVDLIEHSMRKTYGPRVIGKHGAFAGMLRLDFNEKLFKRNYKDPVLVACTDGVGTKVKLAAELKVYDTVGQDLVAMNVNDLIVQGAEPLLFLDYLGVHKLDPQLCADMVRGVSEGCLLAGCALLGGETAEMPDVYAKGDFDMAGFAVGVVELKRAMSTERVEAGDVILGLASSGIHSNGYTLVRAIVKERKLALNKVYPELDQERTLGQVLLTPTRIYARQIVAVMRTYKVKNIIAGMAHITGGGLPGNVCRALPGDLDAHIDTSSWRVPAVFQFLQRHGNVDRDEMYRVFNMGIGYVVIVKPHFALAVREKLEKQGETVHTIGKVVKGSGDVRMV